MSDDFKLVERKSNPKPFYKEAIRGSNGTVRKLFIPCERTSKIYDQLINRPCFVSFREP